MNTTIIKNIYWNNSVGDYMLALTIVVAGAVLLLLINLILRRVIRKREAINEALRNSGALEPDTTPTADETAGTAQESRRKTLIPRLKPLVMLRFVQKIVLPFLFLGLLSGALSTLRFTDRAALVVDGFFTAVIVIVVIRAINKGLEISFDKYFCDESKADQAKNLRPILILVKLIFWIVGIIFLLANLGFDVTAAVAGLGVSGIAVAIAAQGILGDLFNYFVILFDRPFLIGDFIAFDDKLGVVEKIGIKTTRIRTLNGEILIVSNSDLANSKVHNYKKMERRRVVLSIGVTYQTTQEHVEAIPGIIRDIVESTTVIAGVVCDRSHFKGFGNFSLDYETVYYVPVPDYPVYMDVQQSINQRIYAEFNRLGIEFAYPTQTLFVEKNSEAETT